MGILPDPSTESFSRVDSLHLCIRCDNLYARAILPMFLNGCSPQDTVILHWVAIPKAHQNEPVFFPLLS